MSSAVPAGAVLTRVLAKSPAASAGLKPGDRIVAVDGEPIEDALDLAYAVAEETFTLTVVRPAFTRPRTIRITRALGKPWGGIPEPPALKHCGNRCIFCFVDQMPEGLRSSLYVKDEDFRHSFLYGNYVALTNLQPHDVQRIRKLQLSPLYVSVHATDPKRRLALLGRKQAPAILPLLRELTQAGIVLHTQAVICPGWNDGRVLQQTVKDLAGLYPGVRSLAIVPVGLTRHRKNLPPLRSVGSQDAKQLLDQVNTWQKHFQATWGTRWVFAADEWYLRAGRALPRNSAYEDYPQIENGVGLSRRFLEGLAQALPKVLPKKVSPRRFLIPSGVLAAPIIQHALRPLSAVHGLEIQVVPVVNKLFGPSVTVTGLLVGQDIFEALKPYAPRATRLLLPPEPLRHEKIFLDGMKPRDLGRRLRLPYSVARTPRDLIERLIGK